MLSYYFCTYLCFLYFKLNLFLKLLSRETIDFILLAFIIIIEKQTRFFFLQFFGIYRYELKKCLLESPCIMEDRWTSRECLTNKNARIEERCRAILTSYRTCRRQIFDMRARFRGRKGGF